MSLVAAKIVSLNHCRVVCNKITVVAAMLIATKKESCRFIKRAEIE